MPRGETGTWQDTAGPLSQNGKRKGAGKKAMVWGRGAPTHAFGEHVDTVFFVRLERALEPRVAAVDAVDPRVFLRMRARPRAAATMARGGGR